MENLQHSVNGMADQRYLFYLPFDILRLVQFSNIVGAAASLLGVPFVWPLDSFRWFWKIRNLTDHGQTKATPRIHYGAGAFKLQYTRASAEVLLVVRDI